MEQRPHAHAVARQQEAPGAAVPQGEGEVAVERAHAVRAHFLVGADDHLGIRLGLEPVAARHEIAPQFQIVEDLAVERDDDAAVVVGHGLAAAGDVDDAEAGVAEADIVVDMDTLLVGPPVCDRADHGLQGQPAGHRTRGLPKYPAIPHICADPNCVLVCIGTTAHRPCHPASVLQGKIEETVNQGEYGGIQRKTWPIRRVQDSPARPVTSASPPASAALTSGSEVR